MATALAYLVVLGIDIATAFDDALPYYLGFLRYFVAGWLLTYAAEFLSVVLGGRDIRRGVTHLLLGSVLAATLFTLAYFLDLGSAGQERVLEKGLHLHALHFYIMMGPETGLYPASWGTIIGMKRTLFRIADR